MDTGVRLNQGLAAAWGVDSQLELSPDEDSELELSPDEDELELCTPPSSSHVTPTPTPSSIDSTPIDDDE